MRPPAKQNAFFFQIGGFSRVNQTLFDALSATSPEFNWRRVDVETDIVNASASLKLRAFVETALRYGSRIARTRQPPRDFFARLPVVLAAVQTWVRNHVDPGSTAFTFQTQSLFSARHRDLQHFLYTDHTYLANLRYPEPRPLMSVPAAWREMETRLYRDAACNFVSSKFAAGSLADDYKIAESKIECVFSGRNILPESRRNPPQRRGNVILFGGVDWERKGGPELVTAFKAVRERRPDAELWIAGCTPPVAGAGIRIMGRLSAAELANAYASADIFCLPSRMDPSAGVLAEAAGFGLPVVATPVGGNPERVRDGKTGILCEPSGLADALTRLLGDASMRRAMGNAGQRMADDDFTWAAVADKIMDRIRAAV